MTAPNALRLLGPLALALSPMALQAAPGDKTMRAYSTRMETLFIRLDVNRDGRLDASEVQGRRALRRVLKRQNNRSYLLLEDLRLQDSSPSGPRLKRHFKKADRDRNLRLDQNEAKRIPWISRNFKALDGDRDGTVTLQELWNHQRSLSPR
ncbi:MAG: EF-hand domain-containing protein [Cyanobacteriota bacterium]|nr:EF-hand domain-containing protein [Cyanobacteriota bacterium]